MALKIPSPQTLTKTAVHGRDPVTALRLRSLKPLFQPPSKSAHLRAELRLSDFLPGVEAIGAGYDIFGAFASAKSITSQLFDWANAPAHPVSFSPRYSVPEPVDVQQQDEATFVKVSGSTIEEYQRNLSASVELEANWSLFSGSITEEFDATSVRTAENEFSRIQENITTWSLVLPPDYERLRTLLFPAVRSKIDKAETEADFESLFNDYGSHFLGGIIMGGRACLASSTNKLNVRSTEKLEVTATQCYKALTGKLSAEEHARYDADIASFEETSETRGMVRGGIPSAASKVFDGDRNDFNVWRDSVGRSPDFIDFMKMNPLRGLWNLCSGEHADVAAKMQAYFENEWAPRRSKEAELHPLYADYIDALVVIHGKKGDVPPPAGYVKLPQDLNKGAGGEYIYLCYHKTAAPETNNPCIVDITFVTGRDAPAPEGYVKNEVDLNKGAGGQFIYLCYRPARFDCADAIKDVVVISGGSADIQPPFGYVKVNQDLNAGAEGEYIYLCYSKSVPRTA